MMNPLPTYPDHVPEGDILLSTTYPHHFQDHAFLGVCLQTSLSLPVYVDL